MTASLRMALACTALSLAFPAAARAGQAQPAKASTGKWMVEVHGGAVVGGNEPAGSAIAQFPVGGTVFSMPGSGRGGGNSTSRAVSSWYFGDGAAELNSALQFFGSGIRMTPVDEALRRGIVGGRGGGVIGARVSRQLTRRLSAEFDVTHHPSAHKVTEEARDAVNASSASFVPAWNALLATGSTSSRVVTSNVTIEDGGSSRTVLSGGVRWDLARQGSLQPYLTAGAGAVRNGGTTPKVVLTGQYRFNFAGTFPMDETDVVTIRTETRTTPVVLFGGGAFIGKSPGRGLTVDVRFHSGPTGADTVVDTKPVVLQQSPAFAIFTGGDPGVQFSNNPSSTGRTSSLSITTTGLKTLTDDNWKTRIQLTVGYAFRF